MAHTVSAFCRDDEMDGEWEAPLIGEFCLFSLWESFHKARSCTHHIIFKDHMVHPDDPIIS